MAAAILLVIASLFAVATGQAGCPTQSKVSPLLLRTPTRICRFQIEEPLVGASRARSHTPPLAAAPPPHVQFEAALLGMYEFAAADKILSDKLMVLAVRHFTSASQLRSPRKLRQSYLSTHAACAWPAIPNAARRAKQGVVLTATMSMRRRRAHPLPRSPPP